MSSIGMHSVQTGSPRKQVLAWLDILRMFCALEIVGFHWLRAGHKLGVLSCHTSLSLVYPYKDTGLGWTGLRLPFLEYCKPGLDHVLGSLLVLLFGYGWEAVNIFIVISGFVLALGVADDRPRGFWTSWYSRRLKRILIPFYAVALPYITVFMIILKLRVHNSIIERFQSKLGGVFSGSVVSTYLTHIFLIDPTKRHWNVSFFSPAWWFIPAILVAYVCFPAFLTVCVRLGKLPFLMLALVITAISYGLTTRGYLVDNGWYFIISSEAFSLALGIVAGRMWRDAAQREALEGFLRKPSTAVAGLALLFIGNAFNWFHMTYPISSPCFTLGLTILGVQASMFLMRWSLPRRLSSVDAFVLYLVHQPLAFPVALLFTMALGRNGILLGLPFYMLLCYSLTMAFAFVSARLRRTPAAAAPAALKPISAVDRMAGD